MAGGDYLRSLKKTFFPELLSMNLRMSAMFPALLILRSRTAPGMGPSDLAPRGIHRRLSDKLVLSSQSPEAWHVHGARHR